MIAAVQDEIVADSQFTSHPLEQLVQIIPAGEVGKKSGVFLFNGQPVDAMHIRVIEVISADPPGFIENIGPFGGRIYLYMDIAYRDRPLARLRLRARIDHPPAASF